MKNYARKAAVSLFAGAALATGALAPASAAPVITGGLVNVTVVDVLSGNEVNLQVPIAVAANICDLDVNVLAADLADDGRADCANDVNHEVTSTQTQRGNRR